jgi:hypothetical protein
MVRIIEIVASALIMMSVAGFARRLVRTNAPFYATSNITIVGGVFGLAFAALVYLTMLMIGYSNWTFAFLALWGLASAKYIGYQPSEIDEFAKSDQTAVVASLVYIALIVTAFFAL